MLRPISIRLTEEAKAQLDALARKLDASQAETVAVALGVLARLLGEPASRDPLTELAYLAERRETRR